jgi:iron complex transport system ATP-binding protein
MILAAHEVTVAGRLEAVSADCAPGKITVICGPNGAGKSSLLAALAGLLLPQSGAVTLDGEPLADVPNMARARAIGYLPQAGEVAWNLSVAALAGLGRLPHGDSAREPVAQALAAMDLTPLATRPVVTLSGGERARALLARVLATQPRWILADEPLAALDLAQQQALLGHLRRQAEAGTGVVLVLHDLPLAVNHADHVIVMQNGKIVTQGAPESALDSAVIADVWQVPARWLGEPGARALALPQH